MGGCPAGSGGGELGHLQWSILDFMDTSQEKLQAVGHQAGPKCRCTECQKLNSIED